MKRPLGAGKSRIGRNAQRPWPSDAGGSLECWLLANDEGLLAGADGLNAAVLGLLPIGNCGDLIEGPPGGGGGGGGAPGTAGVLR